VQSLIVSEPLCYLKCKFKKLNIKSLKSTIYDFYKPEEITIAKELLVDIFDKQHDLEKWPKPPKRKTGENKSRLEVNDMFVIQYLDEKLKFDNLPDFVAKNVDNLPSLNVESRDFRAMLHRVDTLDNMQKVTLNSLLSSVSNNVELLNLQRKSLDDILSHLDFSIKPKVVKINQKTWKDNVANQGATHSESDIISVMEDDTCNNGDSNAENDGFTRVTHVKRKRWESSLPHTRIIPSFTQNNTLEADKTCKTKPKTIIGSKPDCTVKAAKSLKKNFFLSWQTRRIV